MSPFRKLIDKITGNETATHSPLQLRAFGKLPVSREYTHLEAGQGWAKIFQDWVKEGHDQWVTCVEPDRRGQTAPFCLFAALSGLKHHAIVARIWNSQDSASPPRTFPFTFFAVVKMPKRQTWLEQFAMNIQVWDQLGELFDPVYNNHTTLQELRDNSIGLCRQDVAVDTARIVEEAQSINLSEWMDSLLPAACCSDPAELLRLLRTLLGGWREHGPNSSWGVRLPISRTFPFSPQVGAWLQWLITNLGEGRPNLTGLMVPANETDVEPAIAVTTRPLTKGDFQLMTTNAADYEYIEDLAQARHILPQEGKDEFAAQVGDLSNEATKSLWDWACHRM